MLRDDEFKGDGRSYSTLFREYDPLLGRWMSRDPEEMFFADMSPYSALFDNPIIFVDPFGNYPKFDENGKFLGYYTDVMEVIDKKWTYEDDVNYYDRHPYEFPRVDIFYAFMRGVTLGYLKNATNGMLDFRPQPTTILTKLERDVADYTNKGLDIAAVLAAKQGKGKSTAEPPGNFTKGNFRKNLIKETGLDPGKAAQAHHVLPVKYKDKFFDKGINIHDPKYGTWWETGSHLKNAKAYNAKWEKYWRDTPDPSKSEMIEFGYGIMKEFKNK